MFDATASGGSNLANNVAHFTRVLRRTGLRIGPDRTLAALAAAQTIDIGERTHFHAALKATLISRRDEIPIFEAAFARFWRDPAFGEKLMAALLPKVTGAAPPPPIQQRIEQAFAAKAPNPAAQNPELFDEIPFQATLTFSTNERLQTQDFDTMSTQEFAQAQALARALAKPLANVPSRRMRASARGSIDLRRTLTHATRAGGELTQVCRHTRGTRRPPLVLICDISGSMQRYSRLFLHFAHAMSKIELRVETFVFGTRLTHLTPTLAQRDPDVAVLDASHRVQDWSGGTRIGSCLHTFNRQWARRVLGQNAVVVVLSDGLDTDAAAQLGDEMARLHRSCRTLIWLNPLLSYAQFEVRAQGIKAMRPHVDHFLPIHNLQSFAQLAQALSTKTT